MAAALETIDTMITTDLEPPEARGWLVASADRVLQPLGLRRRETATAAIYRAAAAVGGLGGSAPAW